MCNTDYIYLPIFFGWGGVAEDEAPPVEETCFCVSPLLLAAAGGCELWPWIYKDKQCITIQKAMHTVISLLLEYLQLFTLNAKSHKI